MRSVKLIMVFGYVIALVMSYLLYQFVQIDIRVVVLISCLGVIWVSLVSFGLMWMVRRSINAGKAWAEQQGFYYSSGEFRFISRGPYASLLFNTGAVIKVNIKTKNEEDRVVWLKWRGFSMSKDPEVTWE